MPLFLFLDHDADFVDLFASDHVVDEIVKPFPELIDGAGSAAVAQLVKKLVEIDLDGRQTGQRTFDALYEFGTDLLC